MTRYSSFALTAALACGGLLATADEANAQRAGRGGRGGFSIEYSTGGYGGYYPGGYYGGYGRGYYGGYRDYYRPGISIGFGLGSDYGRGYYGGWRDRYYYSPNYYSPGYYSPSYYSSSYVPSYSSGGTQSFYYEPGREFSWGGGAMPAVEDNVTQVRCIKPDPNAQVWFDGTEVQGNTDTHIFVYRNETPGKTYPHKVKVTWMKDGQPVTQERTVQVEGGTTATVNFTKPEGGR